MALIRIGLDFVLFGLLTVCTFVQSEMITTCAGPGLPVSHRRSVKLLTVDAEGNLYIVETIEGRNELVGVGQDSLDQQTVFVCLVLRSSTR